VSRVGLPFGHCWHCPTLHTGCGLSQVRELEKMFKSMGEKVTTEEIDPIFKQFDTDGNGTVDFNEFKLGVTQCVARETTAHRLGNPRDRKGALDTHNAT